LDDASYWSVGLFGGGDNLKSKWWMIGWWKAFWGCGWKIVT